MKFNRRSLFKKSLLALATIPFLSKDVSLISAAFAEAGKRSDKGIKKLKYIHDVYKALKDKASKEGKLLAKNKKFKKSHKDGFVPKCENCKFYKKPKGDYGLCAMVGAKGKKGNDFVFKNGICTVYMIDKKKAKKAKKKA